jgi:hypothetical protein
MSNERKMNHLITSFLKPNTPKLGLGSDGNGQQVWI